MLTSGRKKYFSWITDNYISELSQLESIPLFVEALLNASTKYRAESMDPSSKFYDHDVLPCIIALIFSMTATSVNYERSFCDLNNRIRDKK